MKNVATPRWVIGIAAALLALLPSWAGAQAIYRIVGPDGKVTFADRPPAGNEKATVLGSGGRATADGTGSAELSFELRQLMSRYPVTLYSSDGCEPCNAGRSLLNMRGVPYTERTVNTPLDTDALQKLSGNTAVPVLTIGGQRLQGFSSSEWNQYLDAAGYPAASRLPSGYRNPPASPLAPIAAAPAKAMPPPDAAPPPPAATAEQPLRHHLLIDHGPQGPWLFGDRLQ